MADLNRVDMIGTVVKDPRVTSVGNGKAVCNFDIVINKKYYSKTANGYVDAPPLFVRISSWISVEYLNKVLAKGMRVMVSGELSITRKEDGKTYVSIQLNNFNKHLIHVFPRVRMTGNDDEYARSDSENEEIVVDDEVGVPF